MSWGHQHHVVYTIVVKASAERDLVSNLPDQVAVPAMQFIYGPLKTDPHGCGTRLQRPLAHLIAAKGSKFVIVYQVDDEKRQVTVMTVTARKR